MRRTLAYCSILTLLGSSLPAAELIVTTAVDEDDGSPLSTLGAGTSLREAVNGAAEGDRVVFSPGLAGATIHFNLGPITVDEILEVDGSVVSEAITLRGSGSHRLIEVSTTGDLTLTSLILENGVALDTFPGNTGGAIRADGDLNLDKCLLRGNRAYFGGALSLHPGITVLVENTTFHDNRGDTLGGAILNDGANLTLQHCTLAANSSVQGGALWNGSSGTIVLNDSLFGDNEAESSGPDILDNGSLNLLGTNLLSDLEGSALSASANVLVGDARLSPIGDYGGPTPTLPPLPGSLAIDAATGSGSATDQRGVARPLGSAADCGAVEANIFTVTTVDDDGAGSLRQALGQSGWTGISFDHSLSGATLTLTTGELSTDRTIAISAYGLPAGLTIDADGSNTGHRVFRVDAPGNVFLGQLTLRGGQTNGNNENLDSGGGILNLSDLTLSHCHVTGNQSSQYGGGIEHQGGRLLTIDSVIEHNIAQKDGGGVSGRQAGMIEILRSTLANNEGQSGGGIGVYDSAFDIEASSLTGNFARSSGGGASTFLANASAARNSTFAGNRSGYRSAGINHNSDHTLHLEQCTIAGNYSEDFIGGLASDGPLTLANTVIGDNQIANTLGREIYEYQDSVITLEGVNCIAHLDSGTDLVAGPKLLVVDPQLAPLGSYGGSTAARAPLPGSPLIDAGDAVGDLPEDQTGNERVENGIVDIGAVEYLAARTLPFLLVNDADGDGVPYGIEDALGLDPETADAGSGRQLRIETISAAGDRELRFVLNPNPLLSLRVSLERAGTPQASDFQEIYHYQSGTLSNDPSGISETRDGDTIILQDNAPLPDRGFYRLVTQLQP